MRIGIMSETGAPSPSPAWRSVPGVEVVAICTSRRETAEAAAKRCGLRRLLGRAGHGGPILPSTSDCGTGPVSATCSRQRAAQTGNMFTMPFPLRPQSSMRGSCAIPGRRAARSASSCVQRVAASTPPGQGDARGWLLGQPFGGTCMFNLSLFNKPDARFPYNWFWQPGSCLRPAQSRKSRAAHAHFPVRRGPGTDGA